MDKMNARFTRQTTPVAAVRFFAHEAAIGPADYDFIVGAIAADVWPDGGLTDPALWGDWISALYMSIGYAIRGDPEKLANDGRCLIASPAGELLQIIVRNNKNSEWPEGRAPGPAVGMTEVEALDRLRAYLESNSDLLSSFDLKELRDHFERLVAEGSWV